MGSKTIYMCDNKGCKFSDENENSLVRVRIELTGYSQVFDFGGKNSVRSINQSLCPKCAEKLGIVKRVIKEEKIMNEVVPTNEQLYNIISQIVWENVQQNQ